MQRRLINTNEKTKNDIITTQSFKQLRALLLNLKNLIYFFSIKVFNDNNFDRCNSRNLIFFISTERKAK